MNFSAALIAGGRSSRMGRDKALLEIDGVPLWRRQLQTLRELNPAEIFIAGPAHAGWIDSGLEIVADAKADAGPLGGLIAVLRKCKRAHLLVLAIDLPNMTSGFLQQLLDICPNESGLIPRRGEKLEPLAAIYPARCLAAAEGFLQSEDYSLQHLVQRGLREGWMATHDVTAAEESLFLNLNTPSDLAALGKK